ncbi:amidase [Sphingomonas koreensis]
MHVHFRLALALALLATNGAQVATASPPSPDGARSSDPASYRPEVVERSLSELAADLKAGRLTSARIVDAYLARIEAIDRNGPRLQSILALNPNAREEARRADGERRQGRLRGPLHGVPIVIKDNIETRELPTTAGSLALRDNRTGRDSPAVARLRAAGAIILGKANLSEWAQFRSFRSLSGWSAAGGLTRNPYALDRSPGGSSSGSAVAVAASLSPAALGTETNSSIIGPASFNGLVGFKPTLGLVPRTHVVPLSPVQDTVGTLARSVVDTALLLSIIAGPDPDDAATAGARHEDYAARVRPADLKGVRLGVVRPDGAAAPGDPRQLLFGHALERLRAAGAEIVEIAGYDEAPLRAMQLDIFVPDFKASIDRYLATAAPEVRVRSLEQLIAFNTAEPRETALFGQELFVRALSAPAADDPAWQALVAKARRMAGAEGIDRLCAEYRVSALIGITTDVAPLVDLVGSGPRMTSITTMAAIAGYPHLTLPMGQVEGLPLGISLIGPAWSDGQLLMTGAALERLLPRRSPPTYVRSVNEMPRFATAFQRQD